jgi:hypothetical protein
MDDNDLSVCSICFSINILHTKKESDNIYCANCKEHCVTTIIIKESQYDKNEFKVKSFDFLNTNITVCSKCFSQDAYLEYIDTKFITKCNNCKNISLTNDFIIIKRLQYNRNEYKIKIYDSTNIIKICKHCYYLSSSYTQMASFNDIKIHKNINRKNINSYNKCENCYEICEYINIKDSEYNKGIYQVKYKIKNICEFCNSDQIIIDKRFSGNPAFCFTCGNYYVKIITIKVSDYNKGKYVIKDKRK